MPVAKPEQRQSHAPGVLISADAVSLRDYLVQLIEERDRTSSLRYETLLELVKERDNRYNLHFESIDKAMIAAEQALKASMEAAEKAVAKAELATERRFEGVNEFRGQLADQQNTLARKSEVDVKMDALHNKIDTAVATINSKIDAAVAFQHQQMGKESGSGAVWGVVVAVLGLLLTAGIIIATLVLARHG